MFRQYLALCQRTRTHVVRIYVNGLFACRAHLTDPTSLEEAQVKLFTKGYGVALEEEISIRWGGVTTHAGLSV